MAIPKSATAGLSPIYFYMEMQGHMTCGALQVEKADPSINSSLSYVVSVD